MNEYDYDQENKPFLFFVKVSFAVIGGLVLGSLIDTLCRKLQNDDHILTPAGWHAQKKTPV